MWTDLLISNKGTDEFNQQKYLLDTKNIYMKQQRWCETAQNTEVEAVGVPRSSPELGRSHESEQGTAGAGQGEAAPAAAVRLRTAAVRGDGAPTAAARALAGVVGLTHGTAGCGAVF